jgi:2-C-methyl-D-erythritol 4-phosphate cytidylyltransferase
LCCTEARDHGGAIVAVPAKDTIKRVDAKGFIQETPKRSTIWQAQTPQIFQRPLLERAYKKAIAEDYFGTDDASLVERIGGKVKVIAGDRRNLKITFPIDLRVAEMILEEGSFDVPQ